MCSSDNGNAVCDCTGATGWEGDLCDVNIDECLTNTHDCLHGGVCQDTDGGYTCDCTGVTGWEGDLCDVNIDECTSNTHGCLHGGVCEDTPGSYICDCNGTGYISDRCETGAVDEIL